jgi:hypothetical protein
VIVRIVAALAALFGIITVVAGTRVLGGADPGYVVFRPLLFFNTLMGAAYLATAVAIWRNASRGRAWALRVTLVNLMVLLTITALYVAGSPVALESLAAMTFRTVVWGAATLVLRRTRSR